MFDFNDRSTVARHGCEVHDALAKNVTSHSEALEAYVTAETELRRAADTLEQETIAGKSWALERFAAVEAAEGKYSAPARDSYIATKIALHIKPYHQQWRDAQSSKDAAEAQVAANKRAIDASIAALNFVTALLTSARPVSVPPEAYR